MKRTTTLALVLLTGCAHGPDVPAALDGMNKALAGVDIALEQGKKVIEEAATLRMDICKVKPPGEERRACMGKLGEPIEPTAAKIGEAYNLGVAAIEAMRVAYEQLAPFIEAARKEKAN